MMGSNRVVLPEFRTLDWAKLATVVSRPIVVDLRNLLDADALRRAGFAWTGLGRRAG
jgi:UDPglucose 6-dehydrogenase